MEIEECGDEIASFALNVIFLVQEKLYQHPSHGLYLRLFLGSIS